MGPLNRSDRGGEEKKSLPLSGVEYDRPVRSLLIILRKYI